MSLPDQAAVAAQIQAFSTELAAAGTPRDAQAVRDRFLGRKNSVVASWMALIGSAPPDQKKAIGQRANELKQAIEAQWAEYQAAAEQHARPAGAIDVTLPGRPPTLGRRHPLTLVRDRMEGIFTRMGFAIVEGPEIEVRHDDGQLDDHVAAHVEAGHLEVEPDESVGVGRRRRHGSAA